MSRIVIATLGSAIVVAAMAGCSDRDTSAAPKTSPPPTPAATTATVTVTTAASATTASSSAAPTSGPPMVGGMTECTKEALAQPATAAAQALGPKNLYTVDTLNCADGWAVTSGLLSSTDNPDMGAPTSFIFEQEGQFWVPKDKAAVCGTNPVTTTPPSDAAIPAGLFVVGCAAG